MRYAIALCACLLPRLAHAQTRSARTLARDSAALRALAARSASRPDSAVLRAIVIRADTAWVRVDMGPEMVPKGYSPIVTIRLERHSGKWHVIPRELESVS